jgi:glucose/arabinose dehydrogenase
MKNLVKTGLALLLASTAAYAQSSVPNMGTQKPAASLPFNMAKIAEFDTQVWRIAFLPDGRMLVNEKGGNIWLVTQQGQKTPVTGGPTVLYGGQGGLLGIYLSPNYARDNMVYLTYSEPVEETAPPAGGRGGAPCPGQAGKVCGSSLALARARLQLGANPSLRNLQVIWRDGAGGAGGQFGAAVAFRNNLLYLSVGDRQRMTPAQDPNSPLGKILRLTLDGKPAPGNPNAGKTGAASIPIINPPADTEQAKTAPVVRTYTFPGPNRTPSETWASGFRTPYGLSFAPNGQLWEIEHGPQGGDELNLIEPGKNYGWPVVSYGINYSNVGIPNYNPAANCARLPKEADQAICRDPSVDRGKYTQPVIYWAPVIAPGNLIFYRGAMFKDWNGSAFAAGMGSHSLTRIVLDGKGGATAAERWSLLPPVDPAAPAAALATPAAAPAAPAGRGGRGNTPGIGARDMAVAPDGAIWISEGGLNNAAKGALYRLTPK